MPLPLLAKLLLPDSSCGRVSIRFKYLSGVRKNWAIPPVWLGLSGGKTPETLSERFLEFPSRLRPGSPKPYNSRHLRLPEHFQNSFPSSMAGDASFFQKWFRRGPLRAGHGIPSSTGVFLKIGGFQRVVWQMFPCAKLPSKKSSPQCQPGRRKLWFFIFRDPKHRHEGTFAKTTLFTKPRLFLSSRVFHNLSSNIEQMDAEDLGRKLLLTPSSEPLRSPKKQTVGTVTASHKMLILQPLRALSMLAL